MLGGNAFVIGLIIAYVLVLMTVAMGRQSWFGRTGNTRRGGIGYGLTLSVLCTSWTYFGAVGEAVRHGWSYLPNFLGPIIAMLFLAPVWQKVATISKRENVGSVADFIASRYGRSRPLGALITLVAMVGALPYIALQLLSFAKASSLIAGSNGAPPFVMPLVCVVLAGLAILFGARRPTLTLSDFRLSRIVIIESAVKLTALFSVAVMAVTVLYGHFGSMPFFESALAAAPPSWPSFFTSTFLCAVTMFTLPRVFHLGFVTIDRVEHWQTARWLFLGYMSVWALAIVPIAMLAVVTGGDPDVAVLNLPMAYGGKVITALAFLGGFSASAAMVMVESIALSAMISNELILPWLSTMRWVRSGEGDAGRTIILVRRVSIVAVIGLSYFYYSTMRATTDLPHLGFASLGASAQLAPALIGGAYWHRGHQRGAFWAIIAGTTIWLTAVAAPQFELHQLLHFKAMQTVDSLRFEIWIVISLLVNIATYIIVSLLMRPSLRDTIQANAFVNGGAEIDNKARRDLGGSVGELRQLLQSFIGSAEVARGLGNFERDFGRVVHDAESISPAIARAAERMLAGAIGAPSARNVIALALADSGRNSADISQILDEAASAVHFSREIVQSALDSLEQGVSVVDRDLRLVAWNQRYLELFDYDIKDVYIGKPLQDLVMETALSEGLNEAQCQARVDEWLRPLREGQPLGFEREWPNRRMLRVIGKQTTTGEYITSFSDVTEIRLAERTLATINEQLEKRVEMRTQQLLEMNEKLADSNAALEMANALAERITDAQSRFVAAAGHDLRQPIHAARLYIAAVHGGDINPKYRELLARANQSIRSADRLLQALLDLSKIEIGGLVPQVQPIDLGQMLAELRDEFLPMAQERGVDLVVIGSRRWGLTNPDLLRSVLQNLIGNAVHYCGKGRVLLAVRADRDGVRIEVRDNGPGIPEEAQELVFQEYARLPGRSNESRGAGLGLAIARRICVALGHVLRLRSAPGKGSVFSVILTSSQPKAPRALLSGDERLSGLRVLVIDDQIDVARAQTALLSQWGVEADYIASLPEAAVAAADYDAVLADYDLGLDQTGLDFLKTLEGSNVVRVLITASVSEAVANGAEENGIVLLRKPIEPASLRALLIHASQA